MFLVSHVAIRTNAVVRLRPDHAIRLHFYDRVGSPADLDDLYLAPSALVPNCRMPAIGATTNGQCVVALQCQEEMAAFLVRRPSVGREGYFVFLDHVKHFPNWIVKPGALSLNHIHFDGRGPDNGPGLVEWILCFPYQDIERQAWHTGFVIRGEADAYLTPTYLNWRACLKVSEPEGWDYSLQGQGIEATGNSSLTVAAGGPLSHDVRILKLPYDPAMHFLLGPVEDAYGNRLQYYHPLSRQLRFPMTVGEGEAIVYRSSFTNDHDSLAFLVPRTFKPGARFRLEWDLGPWGGCAVVEGQFDDPKFAYGYEQVETEHFIIYAPKGLREKAESVARHWEEAYAVLGAHHREKLPATRGWKNFYIDPMGSSASENGQEVYLHGFLSWHPVDPASTGWEGCSFHELGHRFQVELFNIEDSRYRLTGCRNEAFASWLAQVAIAELHGEKFAWSHRYGECRRFFENLAQPKRSPFVPADNVFFLIEAYLPKRCGSNVNFVFLGDWVRVCNRVRPMGYSEAETAVALYSVLAGENLTWAFNLCGDRVERERVATAMDEIARLGISRREDR